MHFCRCRFIDIDETDLNENIFQYSPHGRKIIDYQHFHIQIHKNRPFFLLL